MDVVGQESTKEDVDKILVAILSHIMEIVENIEVLELLTDLVEHGCTADEDIVFGMNDIVLHDEIGESKDDPNPSFEIDLEVDITFLEEFGFGVAEKILEHARAVDDPPHHVQIVAGLSYEGLQQFDNSSGVDGQEIIKIFLGDGAESDL